ncbi:MAG: hypothetical protein KDB03_03130 [Planctomycetales bacterium]|nr:hypothetical protein [Planctomycetales bacterium]
MCREIFFIPSLYASGAADVRCGNNTNTEVENPVNHSVFETATETVKLRIRMKPFAVLIDASQCDRSTNLHLRADGTVVYRNSEFCNETVVQRNVSQLVSVQGRWFSQTENGDVVKLEEGNKPQLLSLGDKAVNVASAAGFLFVHTADGFIVQFDSCGQFTGLALSSIVKIVENSNRLMVHVGHGIVYVYAQCLIGKLNLGENVVRLGTVADCLYIHSADGYMKKYDCPGQSNGDLNTAV